jgi:hypothetical protein
VSPDEHITLGAIFLMLIVDTILYLALTLYVEAIFPGEFGVPQPWNFPFSKEYWHNTPAPSGLGKLRTFLLISVSFLMSRYRR